MKKFIPIIIIICLIIITVIFFINKNKDDEYFLEEVSQYNYYQLNQNQKVGVINTKGETIIQPIYESIEIPNPKYPVFICKQEENTSIFNEKAQEIFTQYEEVNSIPLNGIVSNVPYEKGVLKYKKDGKYGLINFEGKEIIKPIYDEIIGLTNKEGELLVKNDDKYGVINYKGKVLIKPQYDSITGDGFYVEQEKYKYSGYIVGIKTDEGYRYGYINSQLKQTMKVEYSKLNRIIDTDDVDNVYIIATKNGKTGVTKNNKILIDYIYQDVEYEKDNKIFIIKKNLLMRSTKF